ncbi:unnamed protein product [Phytophthora fragariaefolia]|uniref:Unnamed protein product n=1 Tax=Phytophthora fragariaefolia TaxID=1490495 RepID=A0A9W6XI73_9STRA|nr:unnamed protein product [Phytophthora fragariaefolia]
MVRLAAVPVEVTAKQTACLFVDIVFRQHGMPIDIVSDSDPRFTARFRKEVLTLLGTQLSMSTANHPETDGQTERVNRDLADALKSYAHSFRHWSGCLPMAEFAINNSVHVSTGYTPSYENARRHPRVPNVLTVSTRAQTARSPSNESTVFTPGVDTSNINEQHKQAGPVVNIDAQLNTEFSSNTMDFVQRRQAVIRFVQDAFAASVDRQKLNADNNERGNTNEFKVGSLVLLGTQNLAKHAEQACLLRASSDPFPCWRNTATRTHWTYHPRVDARSQDSQLRPEVDLYVGGGLRDLSELGLQQASSCLNAANSAVWRRSTASRRSAKSGGTDPWCLPVASAPTARRTRGNSLDRPSELLIVRSRLKDRVIRWK